MFCRMKHAEMQIQSAEMWLQANTNAKPIKQEPTCADTQISAIQAHCDST